MAKITTKSAKPDASVTEVSALTRALEGALAKQGLMLNHQPALDVIAELLQSKDYHTLTARLKRTQKAAAAKPKARSALALRKEALTLLEQAKKLDNLWPVAITHGYENGSSTYLAWAKEGTLTEKQAASVLHSDFEPDRDETLDIEYGVSLEELTGADPKSNRIPDDVGFDSEEDADPDWLKAIAPADVLDQALLAMAKAAGHVIEEDPGMPGHWLDSDPAGFGSTEGAPFLTRRSALLASVEKIVLGTREYHDMAVPAWAALSYSKKLEHIKAAH